MDYGYARVSTQEQQTHAQIDALTRAGVDRVFEEKRSGGDRRRPVLSQLISLLQPGDVITVYKLDRIARSLSHLLEIVDRIGQAGAAFRSLTETIDTTSPTGRMVMHVIGAIAEFERELIRERTRVGMAAAMARGARPGRPPAIADTEPLRAMLAEGLSLSEIARRHGCHLSSVKRAIGRAAIGAASGNPGRQRHDPAGRPSARATRPDTSTRQAVAAMSTSRARACPSSL